MLKTATLIATLIAAGAFASNAEAAGMGTFYASPFFRNQGRQPAEHPHCEKERERRFEAYEAARQQRLAEIRAERAAEAAAEAAAAKRARLIALEKKKAAAAKEAALEASRARAPAATTVAPKGDLLPVATTAPAALTTGSLKTAVADQPASTPATDTAAAADVCRKYSPAADGLVEVPCK